LMYDVDNLVSWTLRDPCSKEKFPINCLIDKQFTETVKTCQCVPFALKYLLSNASTDLPYCNQSIYDSCQAYLQGTGKSHMEECTNRCEAWFSNWKTIHNENDVPDWGYVIRIRKEDSPFIQFSVVVKSSLQDFLSQLGGLVNLYLGASGFTLCFLFLFAVDLIKRWLQLRKESNSEQNAFAMREHQAENGIGHVNGFVKTEKSELNQLQEDIAEMKKAFSEMQERHLNESQEIRNVLARLESLIKNK